MSYGYDEGLSGSLNFGLNKGKLLKLEFNPNGGKDGAAQERLDILFEINGTEKMWHQFPVTKAMDKNGNEVTNPKSPEMQKAFKEFNSKLTQLLKCFVGEEELKQNLVNVHNFQSFCNALSNSLPNNFSEIELDIFCQYSWQPKGDNDRKFLEIPSNVKQGTVFIPSVDGNFKQVVIRAKEMEFDYEGTTYQLKPHTSKDFILEVGDKQVIVKNTIGLCFIDFSLDEPKLHPITRTEWFVSSNFFKASNDEEQIQSSWT